MSQSLMKVDTRISVEVFEDKFRVNVNYHLQDSVTLESFGVVDVHMTFEEEETITIKDIRSRADGYAQHVLSTVLSHLQPNP